jgi:hypothetical protein
VALGQITLDHPASRVIAGLGYVSRLETMPLEAGQPEGTAQSRKRKIDRVMVRLLRSLGCTAQARSTRCRSGCSAIRSTSRRISTLATRPCR